MIGESNFDGNIEGDPMEEDAAAVEARGPDGVGGFEVITGVGVEGTGADSFGGITTGVGETTVGAVAALDGTGLGSGFSSTVTGGRVVGTFGMKADTLGAEKAGNLGVAIGNTGAVGCSMDAGAGAAEIASFLGTGIPNFVVVVVDGGVEGRTPVVAPGAGVANAANFGVDGFSAGEGPFLAEGA